MMHVHYGTQVVLPGPIQGLREQLPRFGQLVALLVPELLLVDWNAHKVESEFLKACKILFLDVLAACLPRSGVCESQWLMFVPRLMVKLFTVCAVEAIEENAIARTAAARIIVFRIIIIVWFIKFHYSVPALSCRGKGC